DGSNEQKIGDFYNAYMDMKARNEKGISPLTPELQKIDALKDYAQLSAYFGESITYGRRTPVTIGVVEDFKDPNKYMLYTWQYGLGLPEREYYFLNDAASKEIREKYVQHIEKMLTLAGISDAATKAKNIMALETAIAEKHLRKEDTRDMVRMYNKFAIADLSKMVPVLDWNAMLKNAGVKNQDSIVITQPEFVKSLEGIVKKTSIDTWKDYLKWAAIDNAAVYLNEEMDKQNFEFYGKTLNGMQKQQPRWRRAVNEVNGALGEIVGEVYVKKHFSPEAKKRMEELVGNLLKAYEESIKELDWMTPDTKKEALKKLSKFTPKIGYPDKWRDYGGLKIVKGDLYGNIQRAMKFEHDRQINKLGEKVDRTEWGMTPQTVNAYYHPTLNEIVFPAAILQPPFFDLKADDAINYGAVGAVIAHDIGHGLDDQGSTFAGDGVMRNGCT